LEQPKSEPANTNAQRIELVFFIDSQLINILRKDKEFSGKMGQEIKTRNELIRSK
jgi:hypothetical protein